MVTQKTVDLILAVSNLDPDGNSTAGITCLALSKWARAEIKRGAFSPKTTVQTGELDKLPKSKDVKEEMPKWKERHLSRLWLPRLWWIRRAEKQGNRGQRREVTEGTR